MLNFLASSLSTWRLRICHACVVSALILSRTEHAGAASPEDSRAAQALFDEARVLMSTGRYRDACPKLVESQRLDPGGGTLLNIAVCHAAEGRLATALEDYARALEVALRDKRRDRAQLARAGIAKLAKEVPHVTIAPPPEPRPNGFELRLDDAPFPSAAWGTPIPLDPGPHTIVASAPDRSEWSATFELSPRDEKVVTVADLPISVSAHGASEVPMVSVDQAQESTRALAPIPLTTRPNPLFPVTAVVALAAAGVSAYTGLFAWTTRSEAKVGCSLDTGICLTEASRDALVSSNTFAWISTGAFAVATVAGVALVFIPRQVNVVAAPVQGGAAFTVGGTF